MVWLRRLAIVVFSLLLTVVGVGALRAPVWSVEVAQDMAAPVHVIHQELVDFRRWKAWAVWDADVDADYTFTGAARGEGSAWSWKGPVVGQGRMVMTKADPAEGVWFDEAIESEEVNAKGSITYQDLGEGRTRVLWRDEGRLPPVLGGLVSPFVASSLRAHFSKALIRLKERVEAGARRDERLPKAQVYGRAARWSAITIGRVSSSCLELPVTRAIGVGVLKDLKGYVTVIQGKAWVAETGDGRVVDRVTEKPTGGAALMVVTNVGRWRASAISKAVPLSELGDQISARISQVGLPADRPIPFRVRGDLVDAVWHVIDGDRIDQTMKTSEAVKRAAPAQTRTRVRADIVGFYAPMQGGVITDPGRAVRAHIVVPSERVSGHLDNAIIQPMSLLLLPDISE